MSVEPLPLDRATTRCTEQGFEGAPPVAADGKVEDGGEIKNPADQDAADARTAAARQFVSDDFVEGGWRGWLCVLGSFVSNVRWRLRSARFGVLADGGRNMS